jgi:hypothetical protein
LRFTSLFVVLSILSIAFVAAPASADTIAITNPSFETTNPLVKTCAGCGFWNDGPIPGWTSTGAGAGSWQPGPALLNLPLPSGNGNIVAYNNGGTISQTLSASLSPDTTYTLSAFVGHRLDGNVTNYTIELLAGNTVLNFFSGSNGTIPMGAFQNESFSYFSGATPLSGPLSIELISFGPQADFDNVQLTALPAPEPGSLALLATGLGLALFLFRRR